MKGKRKVKRELEAGLFISEAAKRGDPEAQEILKLIILINRTKKEFTENYDAMASEVKLSELNYILGLSTQRDKLLYSYDIQKRKAKFYLETLKIERAKERKEQSL